MSGLLRSALAYFTGTTRALWSQETGSAPHSSCTFVKMHQSKNFY